MGQTFQLYHKISSNILIRKKREVNSYKNLSDGLLEFDGRVGERGRDDQRVSGGVDDPNEDRGHDEAPPGREELKKTEIKVSL